MSEPVISVVMPVYNGGAFLQPAIDSILSQTFPDFELIVIDDGSTDATPDVLARAVSADKRVRVLSDGRRGLVGALNAGLAAARAPLVARMDADDISRPDRFALQVAFLRDNPDVGVVGGQMASIDGEGLPLGAGTTFPTASDAIVVALLSGHSVVAHPTVMGRRDVLTGVGGYRPAYQSAEDLDLWLRVSERTALAVVDRVVLDYRRHGGQVSRATALRQRFSTLLAVTMAEHRREGLPDPTGDLTEPIDWHAPLPWGGGAVPPDVADLVRFFRILDVVQTGRTGATADDLVWAAEHLRAGTFFRSRRLRTPLLCQAGRALLGMGRSWPGARAIATGLARDPVRALAALRTAAATASTRS